MTYNSKNLTTQNTLLFETLMSFFKEDDNLAKMSKIINGESPLSLRIIDWFVTNYAKKNDIIYRNPFTTKYNKSFRVYNEYKLKLKAYGKIKFDPFCRWERITIPFDNDHFMETTIGQLNFFKWAIENDILDYIEENYEKIDADMNTRNSTSRRKKQSATEQTDKTTTRKKREELSVSSSKCLKTETVNIVVHF